MLSSTELEWAWLLAADSYTASQYPSMEGGSFEVTAATSNPLAFDVFNPYGQLDVVHALSDSA